MTGDKKIYCGEGSEHQCPVVLESASQVVLAEKEIAASAFGDATKQVRVVRSLFARGHVPPAWRSVDQGKFEDLSS